MRSYRSALRRRVRRRLLRPRRRVLRPERACRPGPGSRPVQGLYGRADADRDATTSARSSPTGWSTAPSAGMLQTLDPHSSFMDPRSYAQMRERQEGRYYGLGITIAVVDGDITVVYAVRRLAGLPEGPAPRRRHRARSKARTQGLDERPGGEASCAARRARPSTSRMQAQPATTS